MEPPRELRSPCPGTRLTGPAVPGAKVSAALLKDLLDVLVEGCRRSLRLRVEGRSSTAGAPPGWLVEAADFEVLNFREGSTVIEVEAPPLCKAAPAAFRQGDFFIQVDTAKSALALFEESLDDAMGGNLESDLYDDGLVEATRLRVAFGPADD